MTYHIYLDVYFFMNLGMNLLILWVEKQAFRLPAGRLRLILSSGAGAAWSCLGLLLPEYLLKWYGALTICLLGPVMVLTAFGRCPLRPFLKKLAGFYLITVLMAGVMEALKRILPDISSGTWLFKLFGWVFLIAGTVWLARVLLGVIMEWRRKQNYLYEVVLHYQGKQKQVTALLDTGNRLREPYSGNAVHVITYEACKSICRTAAGVLYIPFTSIGAGEGMLPAIKMDEMEVYQQGKLVEKVKHPVVAVIRRPLSPDGEYDMLLNEELERDNRGGRGDDSQGLNTKPFSV